MAIFQADTVNNNQTKSTGAVVKSYKNQKFGFSFQYPSTWSYIEQNVNTGTFVSFQSPGLVQELKVNRPKGDIPFLYDLVVSFWSDVNKTNVWYEGQKKYKNLAEFVSDSKISMFQKVDTIAIGKYTGYEINRQEFAPNYEIWVAGSQGIYELTFSSSTKAYLTDEEKKIISSIVIK